MRSDTGTEVPTGAPATIPLVRTYLELSGYTIVAEPSRAAPKCPEALRSAIVAVRPPHEAAFEGSRAAQLVECFLGPDPALGVPPGVTDVLVAVVHDGAAAATARRAAVDLAAAYPAPHRVRVVVFAAGRPKRTDGAPVDAGDGPAPARTIPLARCRAFVRQRLAAAADALAGVSLRDPAAALLALEERLASAAPGGGTQHSPDAVQPDL